MDAQWDAVVMGSGIGGLAAAAALSHAGRRMLVLERHSQAGGLTQTFERGGFRFNVGMHYLGGFSAGQFNRRLFDVLSGGRLQMAPIAGAYDRVIFPDFKLLSLRRLKTIAPHSPPRFRMKLWVSSVTSTQ